LLIFPHVWPNLLVNENVKQVQLCMKCLFQEMDIISCQPRLIIDQTLQAQAKVSQLGDHRSVCHLRFVFVVKEKDIPRMTITMTNVELMDELQAKKYIKKD
jgi:hypothetical protein